MKPTQKFIPVALIATLTVVAIIGLSRNVDAQANTTCSNAQSYINNTLRENDLRSRVDRLQLYEFMYSNLKVLSDRLTANKQPQATQMKQIVTKLRTKINDFKVNYETYDSARDKVGKLGKCNSNIANFESLLSVAQSKRRIVAKDVTTLHTFLGGEALDELSAVRGAVGPYAGGSL